MIPPKVSRERVLRLAPFVALIILLTLAACARQPQLDGEHLPGFFRGLFDGAVAPVSLWVGWLWHVRMYAFPNSGWFYDLGWMFGMGTVWGGGTIAATR